MHRRRCFEFTELRLARIKGEMIVRQPMVDQIRRRVGSTVDIHGDEQLSIIGKLWDQQRPCDCVKYLTDSRFQIYRWFVWWART